MTKLTTTDQAAAYAESILTGRMTRLRAIRDADVPTLDAWWADPGTAVMQQSAVRPRPAGAMAETLRSWSANADAGGVGFAICPHDRDELIGHVALYGINPVIRAAALGIMFGPEHAGRGYGADAMATIIRYGFMELGLNRIELSVWAFNTRALRTYERVGFTEEGRRRDAVFHSGEFHDEVLMSVLAREWHDAD